MPCARPGTAAGPLALPLLVAVVLLLLSAPASAYFRSYAPARQQQHQTGAAVAGSSGWWRATVADPAAAYLSYGPYAADAPPGAPLRVSLTLAIDNTTADSNVVLLLDVHDAAADQVLASRTVRRTDFEAANVGQAFVLLAQVPQPPAAPAQLEYRVYYYGGAAVTHMATQVANLNDSSGFQLFWNRSAHWQPSAAAVFPSPGGSYGANVGFHFVTRPNGTWVLFHREYFFSPQPQPAYCKQDYARIVVRTSNDRGHTWSNATVMASPVPNTPYECALVDGAGFYDADGGAGGGPRWLYLSQCLNRQAVWQMCLFIREGDDPVGPYTPLAVQPSVASGQLWSTICGGQSKHCDPTMGSEGTPEIVMKDSDGYYYVTFHGWDPTHDKSARGVAKTQDFVHWLTAGTNLPGDALFTSVDCNAWNISWAPGGCVGGGAASILRAGDFFYMVIEAPDVSLGCITTPGQQNWVLGILRSPAGTFLPTGQWEPFAVVPTVVPAVHQGCYIQYARLFADSAGIYFSFWADNCLQIHTLVAGPAALPLVAGAPPGGMCPAAPPS